MLLDQAFSQVRLMPISEILATSKSENSSMRVKFRCHPSLVRMLKVEQLELVQGRLTRSKRTVQRHLLGRKKQNQHHQP